MVTILKGVFDHAPKEILRLITGGIFLGFVLLVFLKVERKWDELRGEPRFAALIRRVNLEK